MAERDDDRADGRKEVPSWARDGRGLWAHTGERRPDFAVTPKRGQESVWDYPRPPRIVSDPREVVVRLEGQVIAQTVCAVRVLETSSPPTFYLPPDAIDWSSLEPATGASRCEWKGTASYWNVRAGSTLLERAAWSYADPFPEFETLRDFVSFYPSELKCFVAGERVRPQPGGFYGGWVTSELVGPFKGTPGSGGW